MIHNLSIKKGILYVLISIDILLIILYNIEKVTLSKNKLIFRGWVDITYQLSIILLIMMCIIFINICLRVLFDLIIKNFSIKNFLKKLSKGIMIIFIIICFLLGSLNIGLHYYPEHTIYIEKKIIIAKVGPSFLYTTVNFYEPVNLFLMKRSAIPSETYEGGYDKYVQ